MSQTTIADLAAIVGERLAREAGAEPIKDRARRAVISVSTLERMEAGELGLTVNFLKLLRSYGPQRALRVLESVVGDLSPQAAHADLAALRLGVARLAERQALLDHLAEAGAADGIGGRPLDVAPLQSARPGIIKAERRSPDVLLRDGNATLASHFLSWTQRGGRQSIDAAIAIAKADPLGRTGVARRAHTGEPAIFLHLGHANRLTGPSMIGRSEHDIRDQHYRRFAAAGLAEAEAANEPTVTDVEAHVAGADGTPVISRHRVIRFCDRDEAGGRLVSACFEPLPPPASLKGGGVPKWAMGGMHGATAG